MSTHIKYGKIAFEKYNEHQGGVNYQGKKTPPWEKLPKKIRDGWDAGAQAAVEEAHCLLIKSMKEGLRFLTLGDEAILKEEDWDDHA